MFSNNKIVVTSGPFDTVNFVNTKAREDHVNMASKALKEEIIRNRGVNL